VVKVVECIGARYELQDVQMGKVYKWCPAIVTVQCGCGETLTYSSPRTTCFRCGADHRDVINEVLGIGMEEDEGHVPWSHSPWRSLRAYFNRPESI
jgi:hypothetical protein